MKEKNFQPTFEIRTLLIPLRNALKLEFSTMQGQSFFIGQRRGRRRGRGRPNRLKLCRNSFRGKKRFYNHEPCHLQFLRDEIRTPFLAQRVDHEYISSQLSAQSVHLSIWERITTACPLRCLPPHRRVMHLIKSCVPRTAKRLQWIWDNLTLTYGQTCCLSQEPYKAKC